MGLGDVGEVLSPVESCLNNMAIYSPLSSAKVPF